MSETYRKIVDKVAEIKGRDTMIDLFSGYGIRAIFDFGSAEAAALVVQEKLDWLSEVVGHEVHLSQLEQAFMDVMAKCGHSKDEARYAFSESTKQILELAARQMAMSPLERLAECGE